MTSFLNQVRRLLSERGHVYLDESHPPSSVRVRRQRTVAMATVAFGGRLRQLVVKPVSANDRITSAALLCRIHEHVRASDDRLASNMVRFLGASPDDHFVLMEPISGATLLGLLKRALQSRRDNLGCNRLLEQSAGVLAAMHQLRPVDASLPWQPMPNSSYLPTLEMCWKDRGLGSFLPVEYRAVEQFYKQLPNDYFGRVGNQLILSDPQPKNILVPGLDKICFIDIDYTGGNPAIDLSQFLIALGRIGIDQPLAASIPLLASWNCRFLIAYCRSAKSFAVEDLVFFYPYVLCQAFQQHANARPWLRSYLARHYGKQLRRFLGNLRTLSIADLERNPERLFDHEDRNSHWPRVISVGRKCAARPAAGSSNGKPAVLSVSLVVKSGADSICSQPVSVGIPFPRGVLRDHGALQLYDPAGELVSLQTAPLAYWPDGSVQWVLLDFVLNGATIEPGQWLLSNRAQADRPTPGTRLRIDERRGSITIDSGLRTFYLDPTKLFPVARVVMNERDMMSPDSSRTLLADPRGKLGRPCVEQFVIEDAGPVRATVRIEGSFTGSVPCRFVSRCCFFAGTGLVRLRVTIHNPNRAWHRGGLWDLGDPGSMLFKSLWVELALRGTASPLVTWTTELGQAPRFCSAEDLVIYQDSSGGENWRSRNHLNRLGRVPCSFRGYCVRAGSSEQFGLRASPLVSLRGSTGNISVAKRTAV